MCFISSLRHSASHRRDPRVAGPGVLNPRLFPSIPSLLTDELSTFFANEPSFTTDVVTLLGDERVPSDLQTVRLRLPLLSRGNTGPGPTQTETPCSVLQFFALAPHRCSVGRRRSLASSQSSECVSFETLSTNNLPSLPSPPPTPHWPQVALRLLSAQEANGPKQERTRQMMAALQSGANRAVLPSVMQRTFAKVAADPSEAPIALAEALLIFLAGMVRVPPKRTHGGEGRVLAHARGDDAPRAALPPFISLACHTALSTA